MTNPAAIRSAPQAVTAPFWPFLLLALILHLGLATLPRPRWAAAPASARLSDPLAVRLAPVPAPRRAPPPEAATAPRATPPPAPAVAPPPRPAAEPPRAAPPTAAPRPATTPRPRRDAPSAADRPSSAELIDRGLAAARAGRLDAPAPPPTAGERLTARLNTPALPTGATTEHYVDPYGTTHITVRAADGRTTCYEIHEIPGVGDDNFPLWVPSRC